MNSPNALTAGARVTLHIDDMAFGGEGVGRIEEFVIFVPFVAPGEDVEVEILEVKKSFARAKLVRVLKPSEARVVPECTYFGECGGCQYQHISYARQLELKHKQIVDLFQRVGGFDQAVVEPVVPCPSPYGYRNRIMIRSQWNKPKQGLNIGFIRTDNRLVVDIESCAIAEPALNREIRRIRENPPPKGGIKVVVRVAPEGWQVPRDSFFQNNFFLLPELVRAVRECVQDAGTRHLIDAYCGVGFFAIELADLVESYTGVELDRLAIQAARHNAQTRGRTNGEFLVARTEDVLQGLVSRHAASQTSVLVDPPRTGVPKECLDMLLAAVPRQVVYVSCHPATLARDLNYLRGDGVFHLMKVTPLDMFPQTQHVECVADLRSRTSISEESQDGP